MTHKQRGRGRRPAFTLIELLVVIAIIAILMSLTTAAVMRALGKANEIKTASEVNLFSTKLSAEQRDLNAKILPSHLRLRNADLNYTSANQAIQTDYNNTKTLLTQVFGRQVFANPVNWNGTATPGDLVLEGEQCLVFWLGGIPTQSGSSIGMTGFPLQTGGSPLQVGGTPIGPYFEFQSARLKMFAAPDPLNGNAPSLPFPVYLDLWGPGKPYAYFCSYFPAGNGSYQPDCPSLGVTPYQEPSGKWTNAASFQIISAGRNGAFGPGGTWNPAIGLGPTGAGSDDQSNFSPALLGVPAN